jgi:DnaA family protein
MQQLTLNIQLRDTASFANFYVNEANRLAFSQVQGFLEQNTELMLYLWSAPQQGRTHLLQASCHAALAKGFSSVYIPLKDKKNFSVELLQGLENIKLICLDDLEAIAGDKAWEEALFHLYNRCQAQKNYVLMAANCAPHELHYQLPDLQSRLAAVTVFRLSSLGEVDKLSALQLRAEQRGLVLSIQVGKFLLQHWPRDNNALFAALDKLDQASLASQRQLTIPFVKEVLGL